MRPQSRPLLNYTGSVAIVVLGTWGVTALEARRTITPAQGATVGTPAVPAPAAAWDSRLHIAPSALGHGELESRATDANVHEWNDAPTLSPDSLAALLIDTTRPRRASRGQTAMLRDIVAVTEQIWSTSERAEVLAEVAELPSLDSSIVTAIARAASRIPSPDGRSKVLRTLIHRHPHAVGASRAAVLDAAASMPWSSERVSTLHLFVTRPRLGEAALADALAHIGRISSNSDRSAVLIAAARANRIEGRARSVYIQAASGIRSERDRSRALSAIGVRGRSRDRR